MHHRLDPLLRPRSIAVVGASERELSVGRQAVHNLLAGGFEGPLWPVNPGRDTVLGLPCFPGLDALPGTAEHVVFCLRDTLLESALDAAIDHGARAVTIMTQLIVPGDPGLGERIRDRVRAAGLLVCGPNGMGFYNARDGVWVCGFETRENHPRDGNVTLLSQSGAGMSGLVDCEERLSFNLAVSTGSEFTVGLADYLDFALDEHAPAAVGLFLETARDPAAFIAALEKAARMGVPVVAVKVGRTALAARLAVSHSGAVAGEDAAWNALFDRYGVQRVADLQELVAALQLLAQPTPYPAGGGLVALHDSGGERQLLVDLADDLGVPLATLSPDTIEGLEQRLDPGLPAVNPLDAWGTGGDEGLRVMDDSLSLLLGDPDAALGALVLARGAGSSIYPDYADWLRRARNAHGKPVALVSNHPGSGADALALTLAREGIPVIDGLRPFLAAARAVLAWRNARRRPRAGAAPLPPDTLAEARRRLSTRPPGNEAEALELLARLGLPGNPCRVVHNEVDALEAAKSLGYPVALKAATPGLAHKSDRDGVRLGLAAPKAVAAAWRDLSHRLGPAVLVAPMAPAGVEMMLGMVRDDQFGPLVVLGFGGVSLEALGDTVCALPPFDAAEARRLVDTLHQRPLLDLARGRPRPDLDAYAELAARFSNIVAGLGEDVSEIDLNPVIVHTDGCLLVDALVVSAPCSVQQRRIAS